MTLRIHGIRRAFGFSLIEILIAVVILATGLLALTALQGRLAQASSEAKTRSRVASMLVSRVDQLRAGQYNNTALNVPSSGTTAATFTCVSGTPAWLCSAQTESSVGSLQVVQAVTRYLDIGVTGPLGIIIPSGSFTQSSNDAANQSMPEFKRIVLTASWTDASSGAHRLSISTDVSPLSLRSSLLPNQPGGSGSGNNPVVRQDNPAGPGVIPIAIGGGDATAASNPRPEILGQSTNASTVGTRFDVLTYNGTSPNAPSVIQRRVETAAIACTCQYGAGGALLGAIYQKAQWPAEWTGERYEITAPDGAAVAPGDTLVSKSGPVSSVEQSPLCTECCRDHHDAAGNATRFDPVRTAAATGTAFPHFTVAPTTGVLSSVGTGAGTQYVEACRLVRVDGFWRTATDMYAKHFGLLSTSAIGGFPAKTGAPDPAAVLVYQGDVKTYLGGYAATAPPVVIPNKTDGGLASSEILIDRPSPRDERYLHARGLYVDYLNGKAQARLKKAFDSCTGGDKTECILPYLPFTTINTTELSYWEPQRNGSRNDTVLTVATGSSLIFDPLQPTRGRTNAKSTTNKNATSDATAIITRSNAGVAVAQSVDLQDDAAEGIDRQPFKVQTGTSTVTDQSFSVRLSGLPQLSDSSTSNDPAVAFSNVNGPANCNATLSSRKDVNPNDYLCDTYGTLGIATTVSFRKYFREYTVSQSMTATCGGVTVTAAVSRPTFSDYEVSAATVGAAAATALAVIDPGKASETTVASFASVPSNGLVSATFTLTSTLQATIQSCTTNGSGTQINNIVWSKPWL